jgi:hypothetical protein
MMVEHERTAATSPTRPQTAAAIVDTDMATVGGTRTAPSRVQVAAAHSRGRLYYPSLF